MESTHSTPRISRVALFLVCDFSFNAVVRSELNHADGNLPPDVDQGVHSLTDVSVFASGPGSEKFRGVCEST